MNDRGKLPGGIFVDEELAMKGAIPEREVTDDRLPTRVVSPREPRWSLAFLGILGYVVVEYMRLSADYPVLLPFQVGKVVIAASLLGLLLSFHKTPGDRSPVRTVDITFVFLLLGVLLSVLFADYKSRAWDGYLDLLRWALIYLLLGRIVVSTWRFRIFIFLFLLLNLKMAQHAIRYFHMARTYWGDEMIAVVQGAGAGSVGFFSNSADFGVAMCVVWPIATILFFAKPNKIIRIFLLTCSAVILGSILVCGSRGAVVGAACITLAGSVIARKKLAALFMALVLLLGIVYVLPGASKERFISALDPEVDKTAHSRLVFWEAGIKMFEHHPLVGVGINNFAITRLEDYSQLGFSNKAWVPHSIYIQCLSELGLAGMVPFLVLVALFFRLNAKTRKLLLCLGQKRQSSYEYCLSVGLDLAMIGYLSSGAFLAVLYYPHFWVLLGLSVGLYTASCRLQQERTKPESSPLDQTAQSPTVASEGVAL